MTRRLPFGDDVGRLHRLDFSLPCYPSYKALIVTLAGLSPAGHTSLSWTHRCFTPYRYLHDAPRLLPTGATGVGRDSHPLKNSAFPRRTVLAVNHQRYIRLLGQVALLECLERLRATLLEGATARRCAQPEAVRIRAGHAVVIPLAEPEQNGLCELVLVLDLRPVQLAVALQRTFLFGDAGYYVTLSAGRYNLEITTANNDRQLAVYRLNLDQYRGAALVLSLTGVGKSVAEGLTMMGINARGKTFFPQVITDTEPIAELPTELTLRGNYPNPFNPSTAIALDLPEKADVTVQVIDMLGRQVLELSVGDVEAGVGRTLTLDAGHLASGAYLYRVIAKSVSGIMTGSGRMVLLR